MKQKEIFLPNQELTPTQQEILKMIELKIHKATGWSSKVRTGEIEKERVWNLKPQKYRIPNAK